MDRSLSSAGSPSRASGTVKGHWLKAIQSLSKAGLFFSLAYLFVSTSASLWKLTQKVETLLDASPGSNSLASAGEQPPNDVKPEQPSLAESEPLDPEQEIMEWVSRLQAVPETTHTIESIQIWLNNLFTHLHLSVQEKRIARLILKGLTYGEIGRQIYLAERTVKFHASNLFAKFGVKSRREFEHYIGKSLDSIT